MKTTSVCVSLSPAVHATLRPLALVLLLHVAVLTAVYHRALSVSLVVPPLAVVLVAVAVEISAVAMSLAVLPVTSVSIATTEIKCSYIIY